MPSVRAAPLLLLTAAFVFTGCAPDRDLPSLDGGTGCEDVAPRTLDEVFAASFAGTRATGCTTSGCHGTGSGGLTFHDAHELWAATVNAPSAGGDGLPLVEPGNAARSFLLHKLQAGATNRMPQGGPYLDDAALTALAGWICAGAPEPVLTTPDGGTPEPTDGGPDFPVITDVAPLSGVVGTQVTLSGDRFSATALDDEVLFGAAAATVLTATSTSLVVTVPAGATSGPVQVTVHGLTATSAQRFDVIVPNPAPTLDSVTPAELVAGSETTTIDLEGSGFVATSTAQWDGESLSTASATSATRLTATVEAERLVHAGLHTLTVVSPGPGGGTTAGRALTVTNPVPSLASLTPALVAVGSDGLTLVVDGAGFTADTRLALNGEEFPATIVGPTRLEAALPASTTAVAAMLSVSVLNPAPGGGSSAPASFTVANPSPTLTSLAPPQALVGTPAFDLVATGTGFVAGTGLLVDGVARPTTVTTAVQLSASIPSPILSSAGVHTVTLQTPGTGGGASGGLSFIVENPSPTLASVTPTTVFVGAGPTTLTLVGSGFVAASEVTANGTALAITMQSPTLLTATLPSTLLGATGSLAVAVRNATPGGGLSAPTTIAIANPAPLVTNLSPSSVTGGTGAVVVTVTGTGFLGSSQGLLDGGSVTTTFVDPTTLTVALPAAVTDVGGTHTLAVRNPAPGGGTNAATFTVDNPVPTIGTLSPSTVSTNGAPFTLTITGSGFNASSTVSFNGATVVSTFVSPTTLTAELPTIAAGGNDPVSVTNPAPGGGTATGTLSVSSSPLPSITGLAPPVGPANTPFSLTVTGSNYSCVAPVSSVVFDGVALTPTDCGTTRLVVSIPSTSAGSHTVQVKNSGRSSGTASYDIAPPNPVPALDGLSPASAAAGGATFTLTLTGAGFANGASVLFDGSPRSTTFVSDTQVTATIPASDLVAARTATVTVANPSPGGGTSGGLSFAIVAPNPAPVLSALSPTTVAAGSGAVTISLTGSGFVSASVALFNGSPRPTRFTSSTRLAVDLAASDTQTGGTATLAVTSPSPGGGTSGGLSFTITAQNPVPQLTSLSPSTVATGSGSFTLTVNGSGFVSGSGVLFNGSARTTTFISATQLTAAIPASDVFASGSFPVTVTSPGPGGGASGSVALTVVAQNPVPVVSSVSPATIAAGAGPVSVTVTGSGFLASTAAAVDGVARTTHVASGTRLSVDLTATDTQSAGTHALVLTNPSPGGGSSSGFTITIAAQNPVPVLTNLSPSTATAGASGMTLNLTGSGFVSGATVQFDGVSKSATVTSPTQLTASLSSADLATAGAVPVTVTNPAPGGGVSAALTFSITNPAPVLTSLSPASVAAGSGAVSISLNGSGFGSSSAVELDGGARTTHFVNTTLITADLLASDDSAIGTHTVTVTNPSPGGGTSAGATLTIASQPNPVPVIAGLSPCGKVAGAGSFTLTITGSGFTTGSTATFNGSALTVSFVSATQLTAAVPGALLGTAPAGDAAPVVVSNPAPGGGASAAFIFGVATRTVTLSGAAQNLFTLNCSTSGCHDSAVGAAGDLDLRSGFAAANLIGVTSSGCPGEKRVVACGPLRSQSVLIDKLLATPQSPACSGTPMPKGSPLTASEKQTLVDWVAQGAPP